MAPKSDIASRGECIDHAAHLRASPGSAVGTRLAHRVAAYRLVVEISIYVERFAERCGACDLAAVVQAGGSLDGPLLRGRGALPIAASKRLLAARNSVS